MVINTFSNLIFTICIEDKGSFVSRKQHEKRSTVLLVMRNNVKNGVTKNKGKIRGRRLALETEHGINE